MPALVCGSMAFDSIATFPGRFADQILADQVHILNVSFLVPTLKREFGGCAGNMAYALQQLGGQAALLAAVGHDGDGYLQRMDGLGIDTRSVLRVADNFTAQAFIITDRDNNQITAFHPGAMQQAHEIDVPRRDDLKVAIIGPDGRDAMWRHAEQLAAAKIPFIFDPGQQLPMFDGDDHRRLIGLASWVAVNDYEARMLCERTGWTLEEMSRLPNIRGMVVTLAHEGCDVWTAGECARVPGVVAEAVLDPTGCGDAFRGGLLYGLERGWDLARCVALGNRVGALKIARQGPQNYTLTDLRVE